MRFITYQGKAYFCYSLVLATWERARFFTGINILQLSVVLQTSLFLSICRFASHLLTLLTSYSSWQRSICNRGGRGLGKAHESVRVSGRNKRYRQTRVSGELNEVAIYWLVGDVKETKMDVEKNSGDQHNGQIVLQIFKTFWGKTIQAIAAADAHLANALLAHLVRTPMSKWAERRIKLKLSSCTQIFCQ